MDKAELEFFKMKETDGFKDKHPNLCIEMFGPGMKTNINMIANQIKRDRFENVDVDSVLDQIHADCKKVFVIFLLCILI